MNEGARMKLDPREAAAIHLAQRSVECGSLLSLRAAIARARQLGIVLDVYPWSSFQGKMKYWESVELEFGPGSALNLCHPLVRRMREESSVTLRHDPQLFVNAERYRASDATASDLHVPIR